MSLKSPVITRFAPSPTGFLHVGSARTALFSYLLAKKHAGKFILRIEDTDKNREVEGAIDHIQESLKWLGIDWDYGPDQPGPFGSCIQSERLEIYRKYAQDLLDKGLAYPDPYSKEEVDEFRNLAEKENKPFLFRNHRPDKFAKWDGQTPLRFKVTTVKRYTWNDAVRGKLSAGEEMLDDFIILKADGYPTYNFAHIIDDHEMGITHVMRGEEFISSTPKYLSLYEALGFNPPVFATLPPIMGSDSKKKLSKRDGAKDILDYKNEGYLNGAMRNFLALIGWNPGGNKELFFGDELFESFSLEKIQRSGGAFNEEKLLWMNKQYLSKLSQEEKVAYLKEAFSKSKLKNFSDEHEILCHLVPIIFERISSQKEIIEAIEAGEYDYFFEPPIYDASLLKWKKDASLAEVKPRLSKLKEILNNADFSSVDSLKVVVWPYAEEVGKGEVLWPFRVALSGLERSPDPLTIASVIGQEETLRRINTACDKIEE